MTAKADIVTFYDRYRGLYERIDMNMLCTLPIYDEIYEKGWLVRYPQSSFIPPTHPYNITHTVDPIKGATLVPAKVACDDQGKYRILDGITLNTLWMPPKITDIRIQKWIHFCEKYAQNSEVYIRRYYPQYTGEK